MVCLGVPFCDLGINESGQNAGNRIAPQSIIINSSKNKYVKDQLVLFIIVHSLSPISFITVAVPISN